MEKEHFDLIIKNNPKHPGIIFENIVFILDILIFSGCLLCSLCSKAYLPALEFFGFVLFGAVSLYFNNRVMAKLKGQKIYIKKFLKTYEFFLEDCSYYRRDNKLQVYIFDFAGIFFKIPYTCQNMVEFIGRIHNAKAPFANEELTAALKEYIKSKTGKPCYKLSYRKDIEPDLFSSKLGGYPYWDFSKEYPADSNGNKMQLLCQLNFEECGFKNELLPEKGMLQFFISSNSENTGLYGMNFSNQAVQENWCIVYHPDVNKSITIEQIKSSGISEGSNNSSTPVLKTCALEFMESISYIKPSDYRFEDLLHSAVNEITKGKLDYNGTLYDLLGDTVYYDEITQTLDDKDCFVLGDPAFTQDDPRYSLTDAGYYDTCLLQLNSDEEILMWGDCGTGNFMINSNDLRNLDFSKVLYNWDCY